MLASATLLSAQNNYFFGDSLTDNGNVHAIDSTLTGGLTTVSNGPSWASYIDPSAVNIVGGVIDLDAGGNIVLSPSFTPGDQSINAAFAGATSGSAVPNIALQETPATGYQVNTVAGLAGAGQLGNLSNDTAFIWTGHNDITDTAGVLFSDLELQALANATTPAEVATAVAAISPSEQTAFNTTFTNALTAGGSATQATAAGVGAAFTQSLADEASVAASTAFSTVLAASGDSTEAGTAALSATAQEVSAHTVNAVQTLQDAGVGQVILLGVTNLGSTPAVNNPALNSIVSLANAATLESLNGTPNILYVDTAYALDSIIANPSAFGVTPDTFTDSTGVFFQDGFHPSAQTHAKIAEYIQKHYELAAQAPAIGIHFDLLRGFEEQQSFSYDSFTQGDIRAGISGFGYQSSSSGIERNLLGARLDLDYAFTDKLAITFDVVAATGDAGNADYDGYGVAIGKNKHFSFRGFDIEAGLKAAYSKGTFERDYNFGNLDSSADTWSVSAELYNNVRKTITVGNRDLDLIFGISHRFVQFDDVSESPDTSLSLAYGDETIQTTTANIEVAYNLTDRSRVSLIAKPVIHSSDVDFKAQQANGLATYNIGDITGYDVHTYGASFSQGFNVGEYDAGLLGSFLLGSDDTMYGNLGVNIAF